MQLIYISVYAIAGRIYYCCSKYLVLPTWLHYLQWFHDTNILITLYVQRYYLKKETLQLDTHWVLLMTIPVKVSPRPNSGDKKRMHIESDEYKNNILLSEVITVVHNAGLRDQDRAVNWLR
jgi:hypothetical protein